MIRIYIRLLTSLLCMIFIYSQSYGQLGIGLTASNDIYQWYQNPESDDHGSAGSFLLNLGVGPKIWLGGNDFSLSVEGQAVLGIAGLSIKEYRGLGTVSFPLMAKFNFAGLSALDKEGRFGFSIGGGIQYNRTELYYTTQDFKDGSGNRDWFHTYVGQVGYGFGLSGFTVHGFARYGYHPDDKSHTLNVGVQYDFNMPMLKRITAPESSL